MEHNFKEDVKGLNQRSLKYIAPLMLLTSVLSRGAIWKCTNLTLQNYGSQRRKEGRPVFVERK